jgi:MoxR-like ATPase
MEEALQLGPAQVAELGSRVMANISRAVKAPEDALRGVVVALFAAGHVLIEDFPGVGKTALARALAGSIDADYARIQGTSDLLPSDVVGANVFDQSRASFEFRPGPIFANLVLVDEINRAPPKTQSGLLECMQERNVTLDGMTYPLPQPFLVLATQNPVEYEGTYALPEAQLDRFMVRVRLGYPSAGDEAAMLAEHAAGDRVRELEAVSSVQEAGAAQEAVGRIHAGEAVRRYIVELLHRTRADARAEIGASPRAGLMLLRAAMAHAALGGRSHATPDDVQAMAHAVLDHRLVLALGVDETQRRRVVSDALSEVSAI